MVANRAPRAHARQIGADQERRLDHADENVGGGGGAERPADAERLLQRPGEGTDHPLQDAPVIEQPRQHAHQEDQWQGLEGENEPVLRRVERKGRRTPGEIAEHQPHAFERCRLQGLDGARQQLEHDAGGGQAQQQRGDRPLQGEPRRRDAQRPFAPEPLPVLRQRPGDQRDQHHADEALQHQSHGRHAMAAFVCGRKPRLPMGRRTWVVAAHDLSMG